MEGHDIEAVCQCRGRYSVHSYVDYSMLDCLHGYKAQEKGRFEVTLKSSFNLIQGKGEKCESRRYPKTRNFEGLLKANSGIYNRQYPINIAKRTLLSNSPLSAPKIRIEFAKI